MSSNDLQVEPHVLRFLSQIEELIVAPAPRPIITEVPSSPRLKRKLSEPSHKSSVPLKSILKGKRSESMSGGTSPTTQSTRLQVRLQPPIKNNVPLRFASRKAPPSVEECNVEAVPDSAISDESGEELFYTPGSVPDVENVHNEGKSGEDDKVYLVAREKNKDHSRPASDSFYTDPPTPMPTPTLRTSFSQDVPYQGYPLTPHNTFRRKRRTPPIVDELDRQKSDVPFPTRQSFTFTPPALTTPSPSEFPLPPGTTTATTTTPSREANNDDVRAVRPASRTSKTLSWAAAAASRRISWRPSLPIFTRRPQDKMPSERPQIERAASKRKSSTEIEGNTKRRKVVRFASFEGDSKERERERPAGTHPPMRRRPTPYYEPLSGKVRRLLHKLLAPFRKQSEEEKEQKKAVKAMKKAAEKEEREKKEREELKDSFKHFDDTID